MRKMGISSWFGDLKYARLKVKHCNKGFHNFEREFVKVIVGGAGYKKGWNRESNFFKCKVCKNVRFATGKDRRNWIFIQRREEKTWDSTIKLMIKDMKKKTKGKMVVV